MASTMRCSSDFFWNCLEQLDSTGYTKCQIYKLSVNTTMAAADMGKGGNTSGWDERICGTTVVAVGAPGSTTNGWVVSITSSTAMSVTNTATAQCVVLWTSLAKPIYVTTCTSQKIGPGVSQVETPIWYIRIADPTSS